MLNKIIKYFIENRLITALLLIAILIGGVVTAPFELPHSFLPRNPVAVDAIPDVGDNQQIIATEWMGRSPKDIQEQITYPLTTSLLGIPGVKTIRSTSMFGMSFIYIIFEDDVEFYWSRSRILEKLNSLPPGLLPSGVQPTLGPDATALGQVFWYTLEGRDTKTNKPSGGWNPEELRTIQDFYVRYSLSSANGVAEVSSIGGFEKEYQVDLDPNAMRAYGVDLTAVMKAVKDANIDVGAGTFEVNKAEYLIRGLGYIKDLKDLEEAAITAKDGVSVRIKDVAKVTFGPADRRGGLDKEGQEAVGGVVVARYGSNPMHVINNVKAKIEELKVGLPEKKLKDGSISKVTIVPFYDRTQLIKETIGTLESALSHEILICIIVVLILVFNLRASAIIASMLPLAVLMTFIIMRLANIEANIVALSGIAIAIGVMVDVGVVLMENILKRLEPIQKAHKEIHGKELETLILEAVNEVSGAVFTAMATTIISFFPVFAMQAQEGKMFHPLAFTKTIALVASLLLGVLVLPTLAYWVFSFKTPRKLGALLIRLKPQRTFTWRNKTITINQIMIAIAVLLAIYLLAEAWLPLGANSGIVVNVVFVALIVGVILGFLWLLVIYYERILRWCLAHRLAFMSIPVATLIAGFLVWKNTGKEFMPTLDEGSFMLMPTSMPHSGVQMNIDYCRQIDRRVSAIPEVEMAVGKWGRANSALDPAPIQMYETTINYRSEYMLNEMGQRQRFKTDSKGRFMLKGGGTYDPEKGFRIIPKDSLIADNSGSYFRQWRKEIHTTDDIWNEISNAATLPGITGSPKLQPIATRMVMLSTGLKAPMGLKVYGPDLASIEKAGLQLEQALKHIDNINHASVFYDRTEGAPYVEIKLNRELSQLADIEFKKGATMIKSENTFLLGYITFDKKDNTAEVDVVNNAKQTLDDLVAKGKIVLPKGVTYQFTGTYEQEAHATQRLAWVIPITLLIILLILYFQFRSVTASLIHFSGVFVAFAGGFILIGLYSQSWFMDFTIAGQNIRTLFDIHTINLSVAVWVGFIALFGIATDDGVLMGTYIHQVFEEENPQTKQEIIETVVKAGLKRIRPAAMTTASTLIALLPVLSSTGKGADIMVPMAIPTFGGMLIQTMTMLVVPVLQCWWRESVLKREQKRATKLLEQRD